MMQHDEPIIDAHHHIWRLNEVPWRGGMRKLYARPNVYTKLSGLGTFERECSAVQWQPVIRETLEMFGAARCLFGSNYPIEKLWTTYDRIIAVMR